MTATPLPTDAELKDLIARCQETHSRAEDSTKGAGEWMADYGESAHQQRGELLSALSNLIKIHDHWQYECGNASARIAILERLSPQVGEDGVVVPREKLERAISAAKAFLRYFNPCDLPEDKSQQWLSANDQINFLEQAMLTASPIAVSTREDEMRDMREALEPFIKSLKVYRKDDGMLSADEPLWDYPLPIRLGQVWKLRAAYDALASTPSSPAPGTLESARQHHEKVLHEHEHGKPSPAGDAK